MKFQKIVTEYTYPDGDAIAIYWTRRGDKIIVSDLGGTVMWIRIQSGDIRRAKKTIETIKVVCRSHKCTFRDDLLSIPCKNEEEVEAAVGALAQAAWLISSLCSRKVDMQSNGAANKPGNE